MDGAIQRDLLLDRLRGERDVLVNRYGVATLAVFGSVARGDHHPGSDIDIAVEFQSSPTFDGYMDLKYYLESLLGLPVDLVTVDSMKPRLRRQVQTEQLRVA
jgi:predicted nucleotidyltransferase